MSKIDSQFSFVVRKQKNLKVFFNVLFVVFLVSFVTLLLNFVIFPVRQKSISMTPDLAENSLVMMTKINHNYERGDLILIKSQKENYSESSNVVLESLVNFFTGQQLSLDRSSDNPATNKKIRRIVGMPGDTFYMRDYVLYIKPKGEKYFLTEFEISPKSYNFTFLMPPSDWDSSIGVAGSFEQMTLKDGEYFVLSDMRLSSDDSRIWGVITKDDIEGKALFSYFPLNKIKFF